MARPGLVRSIHHPGCALHPDHAKEGLAMARKATAKKAEVEANGSDGSTLGVLDEAKRAASALAGRVVITEPAIDASEDTEAAPKKAEKKLGSLIPYLDIRTMSLRLIGDSPLISHRWSEKAKKEIYDKQTKQAKQAKEAKDPRRDFEESLYRLPGGSCGFPSIAFKSAAVDACSHIDGITKVAARGSFHVMGEFVPLDGEPEMREDMVKIGMGTADLRYRGEIKKWSCVLHIRYNANMLSPSQIINLFNTAGFAIGIGEWRPQRDGQNGMFHVESGMDLPDES
jgi:hypothetical protein